MNVLESETNQMRKKAALADVKQLLSADITVLKRNTESTVQLYNTLSAQLAIK